MTIENGQRYQAQEDRRAGRAQDRVLTVTNAEPDRRGRVLVRSDNARTKTHRLIRVAAERLLSSAYALVPAVIVCLALAGCTLNPPPPKRTTIACDPQAKYWNFDQQGKPVAQIHLCFASDGLLTYQVRPVTQQPPADPAPAPTQVEAAIKAAAPPEPSSVAPHKKLKTSFKTKGQALQERAK